MWKDLPEAWKSCLGWAAVIEWGSMDFKKIESWKKGNLVSFKLAQNPDSNRDSRVLWLKLSLLNFAVERESQLDVPPAGEDLHRFDNPSVSVSTRPSRPSAHWVPRGTWRYSCFRCFQYFLNILYYTFFHWYPAFKGAHLFAVSDHLVGFGDSLLHCFASNRSMICAQLLKRQKLWHSGWISP